MIKSITLKSNLGIGFINKMLIVAAVLIPILWTNIVVADPATTMSKQSKAHRQMPTCNDCSSEATARKAGLNAKKCTLLCKGSKKNVSTKCTLYWWCGCC